MKVQEVWVKVNDLLKHKTLHSVQLLDRILLVELKEACINYEIALEVKSSQVQNQLQTHTQAVNKYV